mgnify:CR=1 FL=1
MVVSPSMTGCGESQPGPKGGAGVHKRIRGWELHPSHFTAFDFVNVWPDQ